MQEHIHPDRLNLINSQKNNKTNTKKQKKIKTQPKYKNAKTTTKSNTKSSEQNSAQDSVQNSVQNSVQDSVLDSVLDIVQNGEQDSEQDSEHHGEQNSSSDNDFEDTGKIMEIKGENKPKKIKPELNNMVLTIDVGIKNLAMCIMDSTYQIKLWDVYNMLDAEQYSYSCSTRQKDGKPCEKKCQYKFMKEVKNKITKEKQMILTYTCKRHFPKDMPNQKKYFIKEKKVGDYLLQDITERITKGIGEIYDEHVDLFKQVTHVCIELQPKVNQRMKFTSHIIYAKFVDLYKGRDGEVPVRFIRASQNLQAYRGPPVECKLKTPYSKRKYLSVAYTKWYLEHDILNNEFNKSKNYLEFLLSHSKKDDLCDVSNANINVHKGLKKKQKINKNGSEIK